MHTELNVSAPNNFKGVCVCSGVLVCVFKKNVCVCVQRCVGPYRLSISWPLPFAACSLMDVAADFAFALASPLRCRCCFLLP